MAVSSLRGRVAGTAARRGRSGRHLRPDDAIPPHDRAGDEQDRRQQADGEPGDLGHHAAEAVSKCTRATQKRIMSTVRGSNDFSSNGSMASPRAVNGSGNARQDDGVDMPGDCTTDALALACGAVYRDRKPDGIVSAVMRRRREEVFDERSQFHGMGGAGRRTGAGARRRIRQGRTTTRRRGPRSGIPTCRASG